LTATIEDLDCRVTMLEKQVRAVSDLASLVQGRYEIACQHMTMLHLDLKDLRAGVGVLTDRVAAVEERMDRFEERMDRFEQRQLGHDAILRSHGQMLQEILRRLPPVA
jgi:hypothetical protein